MILSHAITMALDRAGPMPEVHAVQSDRYCRQLVLTLTSQEAPFDIPQGTQVTVKFHRSDGSGGEYSTLPDGSSCWSYAGNVLTVALAPQVCRQAGAVQLTVALLCQNALLHSFPILVTVMPDSTAESTESEAPGEFLADAEEVSF